MNPFRRALCAVAIAVIVASPALAHITPPVVLMSDREALAALLAGARRFFVREVRLTPEERAAIKTQSGWSPEEDLYRFYLGRDAEGHLVAASTFVTEYTVHGPVRVAVAFGPQGRVSDARVVELTEETYGWVRPLIDGDFTRQFVGQDARGRFTVAGANLDAMPQFYGQVIASLIQRAAVLFELGLLKRADAA
jgi:hypothetical protein